MKSDPRDWIFRICWNLRGEKTQRKTARRKGKPGAGSPFLRAVCMSAGLFARQYYSMSLEKSFSQKVISPLDPVSGTSSSLKLEARILTALRISLLLTWAD